MDLQRLAWLVTVGGCLITVVILVLQGYLGYAAVTFAVKVFDLAVDGGTGIKPYGEQSEELRHLLDLLNNQIPCQAVVIAPDPVGLHPVQVYDPS